MSELEKAEQNTILVSVLMFSYNHAKYLRQAVGSVLAQHTKFRYEIIIHDDASDDGSADIIREYAAAYPDRVIPILQTENQMSRGIPFVDDYMMPRVRGKYIAHCEGDDYWTDRYKLQRQVDFLERHPEFSGASHNCAVVDENGDPLPPVGKFMPYRRNYRYTLADLVMEDRMPGQTASIVYRHAVQTEMSGDTRRAYREIRTAVGDRRRTLLLLLSGPVYCMNRTMSAYRYVTDHGASWNARSKGKNLAGAYYLQERDFRRFAASCFHTNLRNDYVLFGTGIMAVIRFLKNRNAENRRQLMLVLSDHENAGEFALFLCGCFPGAVMTLGRKLLKRVCRMLP